MLREAGCVITYHPSSGRAVELWISDPAGKVGTEVREAVQYWRAELMALMAEGAPEAGQLPALFRCQNGAILAAEPPVDDADEERTVWRFYESGRKKRV